MCARVTISGRSTWFPRCGPAIAVAMMQPHPTELFQEINDVPSPMRSTFERAAERQAYRVATTGDYPQLLAAKRERRAVDEQHRPLHAYRHDEPVEMRADIHHDRHGFAPARHAFITKRPANVMTPVGH